MGQRKIKVKICVGTACFVQGGADLLLYEDFLDPHLLGLCEFEGTSCLEACKNDSVGLKAPFVEVDGKLYSEMTPHKLSELLREVLHVGG